MSERTDTFSGYAPPGKPVRDIYATALRHSRRVRRLKILLPLTAAIISGCFIAVAAIRAYLPETLTIESAKFEDGKIVMERPAIAGRNEDGMDYSMTAVRALQDIENPNKITLENVLATLPMKDAVAKVVASSGLFDRATDRMEMNAPFDVDLDNGLKARFQSAHMDVNAGLLSTDKPVAISTNDASVVAQSMRITDKGQIIVFSGQVRVDVKASAIRKPDK